MKAHKNTITSITEGIISGHFTAQEVIKIALDKAEKSKDAGALLHINNNSIEKAKKLDKEIKKGRKGRLLGVPFVAKDNFLTFDTETTAASNILKGFKAPYQSTAVEKLEAEGAILLAKANLDAFGHGASTENSDFNVTKNPYDPERVAGGSSGGSAAAVALDIVPFAIGTDTGGSIRQPASFTGVIGHKPTYGLVSRFGVIAMASSTDTIGPLATNASDAALVLDVISGVDKNDSTTIDIHPSTLILDKSKSPKDFRIGVINQFMGMDIDEEVKETTLKTINRLEQLGAKVSDVDLPMIEYALPCYYIIVPAEISSNLARYDGVKFGFSHDKASSLDEVYDLTRSFGFGPEARRRIMIGTHVLSSGYYDAYYKKAMQVRTLIIEDFQKAFRNFDVLISPTTPTPAFKIGEKSSDPLSMYMADIMTVGASLAGLPAVSVPAGTINNLPVGIQLIGNQKADKTVLELAKIIEQSTEVHNG